MRGEPIQFKRADLEGGQSVDTGHESLVVQCHYNFEEGPACSEELNLECQLIIDGLKGLPEGDEGSALSRIARFYGEREAYAGHIQEQEALPQEEKKVAQAPKAGSPKKTKELKLKLEEGVGGAPAFAFLRGHEQGAEEIFPVMAMPNSFWEYGGEAFSRMGERSESDGNRISPAARFDSVPAGEGFVESDARFSIPLLEGAVQVAGVSLNPIETGEENRTEFPQRTSPLFPAVPFSEVIRVVDPFIPGERSGPEEEVGRSRSVGEAPVVQGALTLASARMLFEEVEPKLHLPKTQKPEGSLPEVGRSQSPFFPNTDSTDAGHSVVWVPVMPPGLVNPLPAAALQAVGAKYSLLSFDRVNGRGTSDGSRSSSHQDPHGGFGQGKNNSNRDPSQQHASPLSVV